MTFLIHKYKLLATVLSLGTLVLGRTSHIKTNFKEVKKGGTTGAKGIA